MKNPKHEIRNPKQIQSTKPETAADIAEPVSAFLISNLFRISGFGFRILGARL